MSVFKNNTAALVQAISVDNTLLDNAVADTKADGQNVRADLSRNTFMLTGNNIWTLNGGGHITWQDNIGAASYIGGVPAPFTPF